VAKKFKRPKHKKQSAIAKAKESIKFDSNSLISFSFKYFIVNEKFNPYLKDTNYFSVLLERLKELSQLTPQEIYSNRSKSLRSHPISWEDTTEPSFDIPNEEKIVSTPYQFELSANQYGRVHGFFINTVFYIRWLDPNHNLYVGFFKQ